MYVTGISRNVDLPATVAVNERYASSRPERPPGGRMATRSFDVVKEASGDQTRDKR